MAQEFKIIGSAEPIDEDGLMEFRLIYQGSLPTSSGTNGRPKEKHWIRKYFHPQLKRLWEQNSNLRAMAVNSSLQRSINSQSILKPYPLKPEEERQLFKDGLDAIGEKWNRAGFNFVPLITPDLALRCSLDIILLRPGESKHIYRMGDIDGQLKTLLDALRIPENTDETANIPPEIDENPFFCLLQDDRLVTEIHVLTDQLLSLLPGKKEQAPTDAYTVIEVKINPKYQTWLNSLFA